MKFNHSSFCMFLVSLPYVAPFGFFTGYLQLFFRWGDGTVSAFPPNSGCGTYLRCYPEYQRVPYSWSYFEKTTDGPSIVFREPPNRPWTKIDNILFPRPTDDIPVTASTMRTTTQELPKIPVRSLIPSLTTTNLEENTIKDTSKAPPSTPPPIYRAPKPEVEPEDQKSSSTSTSRPKYTTPPPIYRRPKPTQSPDKMIPKENPAVNSVDEETPPKKYTTPPPILRTTAEGKMHTTTHRLPPVGYAATYSPINEAGKKKSPNLISWEKNRYANEWPRPIPRRRTTTAPPITLTVPGEPTERANVPTAESEIIIENFMKTYQHTTPRPIYDRSN